ncbi:MAG: hypothetical protein A4S09_10705 [Proteobacteria bacterium SG_bin7]|nr:MAG: hypothetical protein A4S09_10705 [Proteobacteria bacterium SG_bin7]
MSVKTMNTRFVNCFMLLLSVIALADGTQSGGGPGITIEKDGRRVLLDYLRVAPNFKDFNKSGKFERLIIDQSFLDTVADSFYSTKFDLNPAGEPNNELTKGSDFFSSGPFRMALDLINEWAEDNLLDTSRENEAVGMFSPVRWVFEHQGIFDQPIPHGEFNPKIAAYYLQEGFKYTVRLSVPEWNEMGLLSQVGLLLHEGLRHRQILLFPGNSIIRFNDDVLKKATAIMVLCRPSAILSYYRYLLLNNGESVASEMRQFGSFDEVVHKNCKYRFENAN